MSRIKKRDPSHASTAPVKSSQLQLLQVVQRDAATFKVTQRDVRTIYAVFCVGESALSTFVLLATSASIVVRGSRCVCGGVLCHGEGSRDLRLRALVHFPLEILCSLMSLAGVSRH